MGTAARRSRWPAAAVVALALGAGPAGPAAAHGATREATDRDAGVRFVLRERRLTVRVLASAPKRVRRALAGEPVRAACTRYTPVVTVRDTRRWPSGARRARFRFGRDISRKVAWCLVEHRRGGDIAFVNLRR